MNFVVSKSERGFSLIETLVTLVILVFGLLGLAGLLSVSMKNNQASQWRAQATMSGYDIIDRMRSNCRAALAGEYDISLTASAPSGSGGSVAVQDVRDWRNGLSGVTRAGRENDKFGLVSGTGSIAVDAANRQATVIIQWDESRVQGASSTHQVQINGALPPGTSC